MSEHCLEAVVQADAIELSTDPNSSSRAYTAATLHLGGKLVKLCWNPPSDAKHSILAPQVELTKGEVDIKIEFSKTSRLQNPPVSCDPQGKNRIQLTTRKSGHGRAHNLYIGQIVVGEPNPISGPLISVEIKLPWFRHAELSRMSDGGIVFRTTNADVEQWNDDHIVAMVKEVHFTVRPSE